VRVKDGGWVYYLHCFPTQSIFLWKRVNIHKLWYKVLTPFSSFFLSFVVFFLHEVARGRGRGEKVVVGCCMVLDGDADE
jgi:hypothetical protein